MRNNSNGSKLIEGLSLKVSKAIEDIQPEASLIVGILASFCYCMLLLATYAMRQIGKGICNHAWLMANDLPQRDLSYNRARQPSSLYCPQRVVATLPWSSTHAIDVCQIKRRRHLSFWEDSMHVCKSSCLTCRQGAKNMMFFQSLHFVPFLSYGLLACILQ